MLFAIGPGGRHVMGHFANCPEYSDDQLLTFLDCYPESMFTKFEISDCLISEISAWESTRNVDLSELPAEKTTEMNS